MCNTNPFEVDRLKCSDFYTLISYIDAVHEHERKQSEANAVS